MTDPETREQWQDAVDQAHFYLSLDDCKMYGLVTGGPIVNVERCREIIKKGAAIGILPDVTDEKLNKYIAFWTSQVPKAQQ
jgi:hypothetical protein